MKKLVWTPVLILALVSIAGFGPQRVEEEDPLKVALTLKKQLGTRLKHKLQEKGPADAIEYCSERALPITARVGDGMGWTLKRITDKPRNASNQATPEELVLLAAMRSDLESGHLEPFYRLGEAVYQPLLVEAPCLLCHGEHLANDVREALVKRYPDDAATGYRLGQLRGAIKVVPRKQDE